VNAPEDGPVPATPTDGPVGQDTDGPGQPVDWAALRTEAVAMAERAYAPYSRVRVGAAALVDDGRVVGGCNVENASYGLSLCAECAVTSALASSGGGRLVAIVVVGGDGRYLAPCGRCRQLLYEHGGSDLLMLTDWPAGADNSEPDSMTEPTVTTLAALLPDAFGPDDVAERSDHV